MCPLVAEELRKHMRMGPFQRLLVPPWNTLIDFQPGKTTAEDSMRTEAWHGGREWVLRREERAATTRPELGEHRGISRPHADIDLGDPESQVEQYGRAIVRP